MEKDLRVPPVDRAFYSDRQLHYNSDVTKLIRLIDDLILQAPDIPNTYRIATSGGLYNRRKCVELKAYLEQKTDLRSMRIKNILSRVLSRKER